LEIRYTPENESNENLMLGLMNRQQATAYLMRGGHCEIPDRPFRIWESIGG
jgi:hypothetical protein